MSPSHQAIEDDPEDSLSPTETRKALWVAAIAWGVFGSAWMNLITGAPFVSFARALGASTFVFGLLSSLPFVGVLAQLPSAYFVERTRRRKRIFLWAGSGQRLTWFLVAALPWAIPGRYEDLRVGALLVLLVLSSSLGHLGSPAWMSWFADMVPVHIRGRYLGNRAALATVTAVVTSASVGWVLDRNSSFPVFTVIFCVAAALGLGDIFLFLSVRETAMEKDAGPAWRWHNVVGRPLGDPPFRRYLLYALSEAFVFGLAGPFFWLVGLEVLDIGSFWSNFYIMIVPMVFTAMTLPLWGNLSDRFGSRPLVTLGTLSSIVWPVCWLLATKTHYHVPLAIAAFVGGAISSAIQAADMNMIFGLTPRQRRSAYLAILSMASSIGWVLGPSLGGALAQVLKPVTVHLLGQTWGSLHFLLVLSVVVRLLHVFLVVPRLPEEPKETTWGLVGYLLGRPFRWMSQGFGSRGLGRVSEGTAQSQPDDSHAKKAEDDLPKRE